MAKHTYDLDALVAALTRLLDRREKRIKRASKKQKAVYRSWEGKMGGLYGLFNCLIDPEYVKVTNRPHSSADLRQMLKENALFLHVEHGIIVSLDSASVRICTEEYYEHVKHVDAVD